MPIPLGILAVAGAGGVGDAAAYELIESSLISTNTSTISFSNLDTYASTYKHLQVRITARLDLSSFSEPIQLRFNNDTGTNYVWHYLQGSGSGGTVSSGATTASSAIRLGNIVGASMTASAFSSYILDILDYSSTAKTTTIRSLGGLDNTSQGNQMIRLGSGLWTSTAAVTSLQFTTFNNFVSGSRVSLYGLRG